MIIMMKKTFRRLAMLICYSFAVISCIYVGIYQMLVLPLSELYCAAQSGGLHTMMIVMDVVKIVLSLTVGGFFFCLGYIAYNFFRGSDDPEWELLNEKRRRRIKDMAGLTDEDAEICHEKQTTEEDKKQPADEKKETGEKNQ